MPIYEKAHTNHEKHLCQIFEGGVAVDQWKGLVKEGKYFCRKCGRVAAKAENVCDPVPL